RTALEAEAFSLTAAMDLALLPGADGSARRAGLARILEDAPDEARAPLLRVAAGAALDEEPALAGELLGELRERAPRDRSAHLSLLRLLASDRERVRERPEAWLGLGHATDDAEAAAELLLHGLRA